MTRERTSCSTRIVHGLVLCNYPARAIALLPSRRLAACIIVMSVEPRKIGPHADCPCSQLSQKLNFEQGQGHNRLRIGPSALSWRQFVEQCLGFHQIKGGESFGKPAVGRDEKIARLILFVLSAP